jgi:1-acyl-sn-glycerol-3-phosphate acyltransferase
MSNPLEQVTPTPAEAVGSMPAPPPRLRDWLFTPLFLLAFGATLLVFDPLQRLARLFGRHPQEVVAGALQLCLVWTLRLCGTRMLVERDASVAPHTPYILIANHQSLFDVPMFGAFLFTNYPKYVSKRELSHWIPSISYNLRRGGNGLIDRGDRDQAEEVIRDLGRRSQERGVSVVIYPEGTRARSGAMRRFKRAGTLALLDAAPKLDVVPVAIDGSWRLFAHSLLPIPFGVRVRIRFCPPLPRDGAAEDTELLARSREMIAATIRGWREEVGGGS